MTITPPSSIPVSVDYTGRDFYSLRTSLIARIQDRIPNWTASDPSDFGVAFVEAMAYMGDLISYYIDRAANETSITTATQRSSVVNIAQTYGYTPTGYRAASTTLQFVNNSSTDLVIPNGTVVTGTVNQNDAIYTVYFTTTSDCYVGGTASVVPGPYTVLATEGRSISRISTNLDSTYPQYGEQIGLSTQTPYQVFTLSQTPVVDNSVVIYVLDGTTYTQWTQVQHMIDYGPSDLVYTVSSDDNNVVSIQFGDGINGAIPVNYSVIRAQYTVGGGTIGNVAIGALTSFSYVPGVSDLSPYGSVYTVTNTSVGVSGDDPESTDSIRYAAPSSLTTGNRAVTLADYSNLALSVSNVGKANATAATWTSVTLYLAPIRNTNDSDLQPGLDSIGNPTVEFTNLSAAVQSFLSDKILLGTTVTIQYPTYTDIDVSVTYVRLPQYIQAQTDLNVQTALLSAFGYNGMNFQDTIYPQDLEFILNQTVGVKTAKVTALYASGGSGLNTLTGTAGQIFRLQQSNITMTSS